VTDLDILEQAKKCAFEILETDPALENLDHPDIMKILEHRWSHRLGLAEVG
jgi:hypothetical protein